MPASDILQAGSRFQNLIQLWRVIIQRVKSILPARWILLLAGFACIVYSQYLMETRNTLGEHSDPAEFLNAAYRLAIVNYDNVYHALPYFFFGGLIFLWLATPSTWKTGFTNWAAKWPARNSISIKSN